MYRWVDVRRRNLVAEALSLRLRVVLAPRLGLQTFAGNEGEELDRTLHCRSCSALSAQNQ